MGKPRWALKPCWREILDDRPQARPRVELAAQQRDELVLVELALVRRHQGDEQNALVDAPCRRSLPRPRRCGRPRAARARSARRADQPIHLREIGTDGGLQPDHHAALVLRGHELAWAGGKSRMARRKRRRPASTQPERRSAHGSRRGVAASPAVEAAVDEAADAAAMLSETLEELRAARRAPASPPRRRRAARPGRA
jgi:hypothetical protein